MGKLNSLIDSLSVAWDWIVWFLKFLWNAIITIFNTLWNMFLSIFNWELFDIVNWVFTTLSYYLGSYGAFLFISLFVLVFSLMLVSFVFRFLKWRINYDSTLKTYHRTHSKLNK